MHASRLITLAALAAITALGGFGDLGLLQSAHAQSELDNIRERIAQARENLDGLRQRFIQPELDAPSYQLERRLQEGLVLLELGDPGRAAVLLLDIVERDAWRNQDGYDRALFHLGRALYESGNDQSARKWLLTTLERGNPEDFQPAITLLIELGIRTGDWTDIDEVYTRYERSLGSQPPPELLYARGKGLYAEKRYDDAIAIFSRVAPNTTTGLAARYFSGVSRLKSDPPDFDGARVDFLAVTEQAVSADEDAANAPRAQEIRDLANIAVARIHYERKEWADALDTYQNVSRNSPHFDTALFEITWTHIRQSEEAKDESTRRELLDLALRDLDILLLTRPDSLFMPDAKRLRGDILKDLGSYGKALDAYNEILNDFEPVLREVELVTEGQPDELAYFQNLIKRDTVGSTQYIPRSAARWVSPDKRTQRASDMVDDLSNAYENMEESRNLVDEVQAAIDSENRYELYPQMREAWLSSLEYESILLELMKDLNTAEASLLGVQSNPTYEQARDARQELELRYQQLPQDRETYFARERALKGALAKRKLRAYRLRISIESTESQIDAMERWLLIYGPKAKLSTEDEGRIRATLAESRNALVGLKDELRDVEHDLRVQGSLGGLDPEHIRQETELRKQYKLSLLREKDALATLRSGGGQLNDIDAMRSDVQALDANLDSFRSQITGLVDEKTREVREVLEIEKKNLARYQTEFQLKQGKVERVAGVIAYKHWQHVREVFSDLILAADVGVIDVAWLKKERNSRKLTDLKQERTKEREILQEDFEQIIREIRGSAP